MKFRFGKLINTLKNNNSFYWCIILNNKFCNLFNSDNSVTNEIQDKTNKNIKFSCTKELRLFYYTFFYNDSNDTLGILETLLYPLAKCFSKFLRYVGWFLVGLVWVLSLNMLFVFYTIIVPQLYKTSWVNFLIHFSFGSWLGLNTFFHYTMGLITNPGQPPKENIYNVVNLCRKCISPKPPRTHHCSICNKCILKMDHHCPWFNNCIGFYNHRYFFLFCCFMTIDCFYLVTFGFHFYQMHVYPSANINIFSLIFLEVTSNEKYLDNILYYKLTTIEFFVLFTIGFTLFLLSSFNAFIISKGATNIEIKSMRIPCCPKTYSNPKSCFDLGFKANIKIFFGFNDFKSFVRRVLLPSTHLPLGDGINWKEYINHLENRIIIYDV